MTALPSLFNGKTILAPMVRVCGLGFRVMCADHGADVIFSEEVVAAKLAASHRELRHYPSVPEPIAEYVVYEQFKNQFKRTLVLAVPARGSDVRDVKSPSPLDGSCSCSSSSEERRPPLILQLGVANASIGAAAALHACGDIDAIDVNMGCPKKFSISNGFGAALMRNTALAGSLVGSIEAAVNSEAALASRGGRVVPVSLKTRLKDTAEETVQMLREMLIAASAAATSNSGKRGQRPVVHAITLHARTPELRSEKAPLYERASDVVRLCRQEALFTGVCFVLNGSVESRRDGEAKRTMYGFDGAMLARAALNDPSRFERLPACETGAEKSEVLDEAHYMRMMKELMIYSVRYRAVFNNFKYHLTRAFPEVPAIKHLMAEVQTNLRSYADCYNFFKLTAEERTLMNSCAFALELVPSVPEADGKQPEALVSAGDGDDETTELSDTSLEGKRRRVEAEIF